MLSLIAVIPFWTLYAVVQSQTGIQVRQGAGKNQSRIKKSQITRGTNLTKGWKAERTKTNMEREPRLNRQGNK